MFNSLPNEYQNFVTSFYVSSLNETPLFEVVGLLLQEEKRLKKNDLAEPNKAFTRRNHDKVVEKEGTIDIKIGGKFFKSNRDCSRF